MRKVVGLVGYAGSGKSTVARHLVDRHGFTLVKFAGPLKSMMHCLGLGDREIEGDLKEEPHRVLNYKTPRYAMQTLGTEWGRELIGQDLWVDVARESTFNVIDQGGRVVLDDVRFSNELAFIRSVTGTVLRISRPGVGPVNAHSSDNQDLDADLEILNTGSIDDLVSVIDDLLTESRHD